MAAETKKSHYLIQLSPCDESCGSLEDKTTGINEAGVQGDHEDNSVDSHSSSTYAVACREEKGFWKIVVVIEEY